MSFPRSCFSVLSSLLKKMQLKKKERRSRPKRQAYQLQKSFIQNTPKGFVPIIAGDETETKHEEERFLVHVKLLNKPSMVELLELAARQFGFDQEGVLRVPCSPHHFQEVLDSISQERLNCAELLRRWLHHA